MTQNNYLRAIDLLKEKDETLSQIISKVTVRTLSPNLNVDQYFFSLCQDIISQQLSTKVADVIIDRFLKLFPSGQPTPVEVLALPDEALRAVGLSGAKTKYIKDLAHKTLNHELAFEKFNEFDDETIITELIKVKGIGRWTAEMFLIFTLGREDVFSHGDLGLKNALLKWYTFDENQDFKFQAEKIVAKWSPYQSYGSLVLWKSLELK